MPDLNLRPISTSGPSRPVPSKPIPTASLLSPWQFDYIPSRNGQDTNLLIMFHGLGDTKTSFTTLGQSLNLPNTAVLSLQAPNPLPLMENPSWSWYNTFSPIFEPLPHPDPSKTLPALAKLLDSLTSTEMGWQYHDIHLFGWGQGGTMAIELAYEIGKTKRRLGSVVCICGGLLSYPSTKLDLETPVFNFTRADPLSSVGEKASHTIKRAFKDVEVVRGEVGRGEDMPRGRAEWQGVMRFWGKVLSKPDEGWRGGGEVYEVVR